MTLAEIADAIHADSINGARRVRAFQKWFQRVMAPKAKGWTDDDLVALQTVCRAAFLAGDNANDEFRAAVARNDGSAEKLSD